MKYTVVWNRSADDSLVELWMNATDRNAVTQAVREIDAQLGQSPLEVGESREVDYRILCILPLVVAYRVSEDDRLATVVKVRAV